MCQNGHMNASNYFYTITLHNITIDTCKPKLYLHGRNIIENQFHHQSLNMFWTSYLEDNSKYQTNRLHCKSLVAAYFWNIL